MQSSRCACAFNGLPQPRHYLGCFSSRPQAHVLPASHSIPPPSHPLSLLLGTPEKDLGDVSWRWPLPGCLLGRGSQRKPDPRRVRNITSPFLLTPTSEWGARGSYRSRQPWAGRLSTSLDNRSPFGKVASPDWPSGAKGLTAL